MTIRRYFAITMLAWAGWALVIIVAALVVGCGSITERTASNEDSNPVTDAGKDGDGHGATADGNSVADAPDMDVPGDIPTGVDDGGGAADGGPLGDGGDDAGRDASVDGVVPACAPRGTCYACKAGTTCPTAGPRPFACCASDGVTVGCDPTWCR